MPIYGPHNLRWLAGPDAADQLTGIANPMGAAEGTVPEIFGRIMDEGDKSSALEDIYDQLHPLAGLWDRLGSNLEDYARPRLIQNMLGRMEGNAPGTMTNLYDAGLSGLLSLMKKAQNASESAEWTNLFRKTLPNAAKGLRDKGEPAD